MLQRSAAGLYSHIFFGNGRSAAESTAGAWPNDSSFCCLSSHVIRSSPPQQLDAFPAILLPGHASGNAENRRIVPHSSRRSPKPLYFGRTWDKPVRRWDKLSTINFSKSSTSGWKTAKSHTIAGDRKLLSFSRL